MDKRSMQVVEIVKQASLELAYTEDAYMYHVLDDYPALELRLKQTETGYRITLDSTDTRAYSIDNTFTTVSAAIEYYCSFLTDIQVSSAMFWLEQGEYVQFD